jgi:ribA/ribD-fused uncharacterized protein
MIKEFKDEYRWLSNFAPVEIRIGDRLFESVEHAYQSTKSDDVFWKGFCRTEKNPVVVKREAKKIVLRKDWEEVKEDIMLDCLRQKFSQEPYKQLLLDTKNQEIQEGNWWGDDFWGVNLKTGKGQNKLGKMIVQVRKEIR